MLYTLPIYFLIFLANDRGLFTWLREAAASHMALSFLPMGAASVVIFSLAAGSLRAWLQPGPSSRPAP